MRFSTARNSERVPEFEVIGMVRKFHGMDLAAAILNIILQLIIKVIFLQQLLQR
jgi:hypothetical protein